jgi:hypothetical protein
MNYFSLVIAGNADAHKATSAVFTPAAESAPSE